MNIVWGLCRRPEREFASNRIIWIWFPTCHTGVFLYWRMIIPFVEKPVFSHIIRPGKTSFNISKFIRYSLMDIANTRLVVDLDLWMFQGFIDSHKRR